jgi:site-specific recombinase XerD
VRGKGGRRRTIPVEDSELRSVLDGYIEAHKPESDEHLLYPERTGAVRWEDRRKPLSDTAAHRWWHACFDRAGVKHLPMHSARHTAITDIVRVAGNLKAAKLFAGHASIQTTADIYAHFHLEDLREALRIVGGRRAERRMDGPE